MSDNEFRSSYTLLNATSSPRLRRDLTGSRKCNLLRSLHLLDYNDTMTVLDEIVETKRREIAALKAVCSLETLQKEAEDFRPERRPFRTLFEKGPVLIAEIKPRSPSAGELIADSPLEIADLYAKSNADVISVLTEADYFGGSNDLLKQVRARVPQAILRKDFIIDEYQVYETLLLKADVYL